MEEQIPDYIFVNGIAEIRDSPGRQENPILKVCQALENNGMRICLDKTILPTSGKVHLCSQSLKIV